MSFLTAEWRRLAFANYVVDPEVLKPYLPYGTELDLWQGRCYASLIGFMFKNTRLLGIKVPFHINFEEVNLRFYVKRFEDGEWKRGVVFVKEIVPLPALTFVANTLYNEKYETRPMSHRWEETDTDLTVEYRWKIKSGWQSLQVTTGKELTEMIPGSETEFITEHYWGYAEVNPSKTNEYRVTHPKWKKYEVLDYKIKASFAELYGNDFAFLNHQQPESVMLAEGSAITIESKRVLKSPKS
jgi:hypothetical protein